MFIEQVSALEFLAFLVGLSEQCKNSLLCGNILIARTWDTYEFDLLWQLLNVKCPNGESRAFLVLL